MPPTSLHKKRRKERDDNIMKKCNLLLATLLLATAITGCSSKTTPSSDVSSNDTNAIETMDPLLANAIQEKDDATELNELLGTDMTIDAKDSAYAVISNSIGEVIFSIDDVTYTYRASKDLSGDAMAGIQSAMKDETTENVVKDVTCYYGSYDDGTRIAFWTLNELNYTLTCASVSDDVLTDAVTFVLK